MKTIPAFINLVLLSTTLIAAEMQSKMEIERVIMLYRWIPPFGIREI